MQEGPVDQPLPLVAEASGSDDDIDLILGILHSGSQEEFKKKWIEFDCQKGVHHGKYATYETDPSGRKYRKRSGHLGRFNLVKASGSYGEKRVIEFIRKHNCHYADRFKKDLDECGIGGIEVESWPSGRSDSRLPISRRPSGSEER